LQTMSVSLLLTMTHVIELEQCASRLARARPRFGGPCRSARLDPR
jgi:hypothetical protein